MGVSPVYAMLVGASVLKFGLLPGFIAGAIAGLMVMYGFNDPMKVTLCFLCIMVSGIIAGYIHFYSKTIQFVQRSKFVVREERQQNRQLNRIVVSNFL